MVTCYECFCESGETGRNLQKLVDEKYPDFACEAKCCSPFSSCPVKESENLAFILIDPLHYDEDRQVVVPEAFKELTERDLSVLRIEKATRREAEDIRRRLIDRGQNRPFAKMRFVNEVCIGAVSEIRSTIENGRRLLGVYDTALESTPSHASIFTRRDVLEDKQLRKLVRFHVHKILSKKRVNFAEFSSMLEVKNN